MSEEKWFQKILSVNLKYNLQSGEEHQEKSCSSSTRNTIIIILMNISGKNSCENRESTRWVQSMSSIRTTFIQSFPVSSSSAPDFSFLSVLSHSLHRRKSAIRSTLDITIHIIKMIMIHSESSRWLFCPFFSRIRCHAKKGGCDDHHDDERNKDRADQDDDKNLSVLHLIFLIFCQERWESWDEMDWSSFAARDILLWIQNLPQRDIILSRFSFPVPKSFLDHHWSSSIKIGTQCQMTRRGVDRDTDSSRGAEPSSTSSPIGSSSYSMIIRYPVICSPPVGVRFVFLHHQIHNGFLTSSHPRQ